MEIIYCATAVCLIAFIVLATYDGFYLHLWKFELFKFEESKFEHQTHTVRAVLFPMIVWLLFLSDDSVSFWLGLLLVLTDLIVLGIDAYSEKDSRKFMGGLPRWEYIVHLFANGFHFAAVAMMVSIRIVLSINGDQMTPRSSTFPLETLTFVAENAMPGAIFLGAFHVFLMLPIGQKRWFSLRSKLRCC